jgi:phosphoglycerate dehydrogenase-like enzyme
MVVPSLLVGLVVVGGITLGTPRAGAQEPALSPQWLTDLGMPEAETPVREMPGWKPPTRVLVSRPSPERLEALRAVAPGVDIVVLGPGAPDPAVVASADALIGSCSASILAAGTNIRWVQSIGAGVEGCLTSPLIRDRGILLTNTQRVLAPTLAEHVIAMALSFARSLPVYRDQQREGVWRTSPAEMFTLKGRTMLLVGLGGVGTEVATRAHALGMTVTAIRSSDRPGPPTVSRVGQSPALLEFVADADIVVNSVPLTDDTRAMFDARVFAAMKQGAYFINVGRGASVVTDDLVKALQSGHLAGAGLDVTEREPLPANHVLWTMPNVLITPHVAPNSAVDFESRWLVFRENLRRYVAGDRMLSVVDTTRGY